MEQTRTISVTITVDPKEETFSVETLEGESGLTAEFGPTPLWANWEMPLKEMIGNEIVSWIELMSEDEKEDE